MVADGMGLADVTAARIRKNGISGPPLQFETLDEIGYQRSCSEKNTVTDSAAAASAAVDHGGGAPHGHRHHDLEPGPRQRGARQTDRQHDGLSGREGCVAVAPACAEPGAVFLA
jgi:hypothetical protein